MGDVILGTLVFFGIVWFIFREIKKAILRWFRNDRFDR